MEALGIIESVTGALRIFFIILAVFVWVFRHHVRRHIYFLLPLVAGAVVAGVSLVFPMAELFLAIGLGNIPECLSNSACKSNFNYSVNHIMVAFAFLATQMFLYTVSKKGRPWA